jgi:hypothetical protein
MHRTDRTSERRPPTLRALARIGVWLCTAALSASAHGQVASDVLPRLIAYEAEPLLVHADPVVRGEAALLLAARGDARLHEAIVAVAKDPEEAASIRGLLALGILATPGVEAVLESCLADLGNRQRPTSIAAAYALGSLPSGFAAPIVSRTLSSCLHGSPKRQRPLLTALLLGMTREPQPVQLPALRRLFEDDALRDPTLRAQVLATLLPIDATFTAARQRRVFERASEPERLALLHWMAADTSPLDPQWLPWLERLAAHGPRAELRSAALAVLTRARHLPALEVAASALRSEHVDEAAQGLRSVLTIGGAAMRGPLESHLRADPVPLRQAALLRAYQAPPSRDLADHCARTAADATLPPALRTAAATLLAKSDPERAAPLLRDLFRSPTVVRGAGAGNLLTELAVLLMRAEATAPSLDRLLPGTADLTGEPERWRALVLAGHPEALRSVVAVLQQTGVSPALLARALRCWR